MASRKNRNKNRTRRRRARPQPLAAAPPQSPRRPPTSPAPASTPAITANFAALALCLLVALSYFPALGAGFVWDDVVLTEARALRSWSGLWEIWFAPRTLSRFEGHYWPLLYTTFWLEHQLWGFAAAGYHAVNLLLHGSAVLLLWRLLLRLNVPGAWFAAAVFAVHPLHVESVAWVIGRKDVLAALFYLACALCYLRFMADRRRGFYIGALALFVTGLLCKSTLITLPVALLIWHWWKQGFVTLADLRRVLPFLLLGLAITAADVSFYKDRDPTAFDYSLVERALLAARALWFYAGKLVWPADLAVIYPRWEVRADLLGWACLLAAGATAAALWFARRRIGRGPLAGALFFAVALSPTLGFVDYGYMLYSFVADRYQYLAGIGVIATLSGAAVWGLGKLPGVAHKIAPVAPVGAALLLAVLATITWNQAGIYRDNVTFYTHVIALNPQARFAHHSLGLEYQKQGRHEEALAAFRTDYEYARGGPSAEIRLSKAHTAMGTATEALERLTEAEEHYRRAVELTPRFPGALENLGAFLIKQKRFREALEIFQALTVLTPGDARFQVGVGVALAGLRRIDEALQSYERALRMDPSLEQARVNRESLLKYRESGGE